MKRIDDFYDVCPEHGGEVKAEYDFSGCMHVMTFDGCKCAVSVRPWPDDVYYHHDNYQEAKGAAILQRQMELGR